MHNARKHLLSYVCWARRVVWRRHCNSKRGERVGKQIFNFLRVCFFVLVHRLVGWLVGWLVGELLGGGDARQC
jgi:hypothetical protein